MTTYQLPHGEWDLFPIQQQALDSLAKHRKGFFSMGVGSGKTLTSMLAARALDMDPDRVLILTQADLVKEAAHEAEIYGAHFDIPAVEYVSYSWMSRNEKYFWEKRPLLIVADECHKLRNPQANRTHAFLRYMQDSPETIFVPMSGTLTTTSILDYAHLMRMALGEESPLPSKFFQLQALARVVDSRPISPPDSMDYQIARHVLGLRDGETYREALYRRLSEAPGVVISEESAFDGPHEVRPWKFGLPAPLHAAIQTIDKDLVLPNGMMVDDPLGQGEKKRQLAQGFFYYPIYTEAHTPGWTMARRDKNELIAETIKSERRKKHGLITTARVENAFRSGEMRHPYWDRWVPYEEVPEPETETEFMDGSIIDAAIARARSFATEDYSALLWYEHESVRDYIDGQYAGDYGVHVAERGKAPPRGDERKGVEVAVVSLRSHSTGLNLQRDYAYNLLLCTPSNGGLWEQMLGRCHRPGQLARVITEFNASTNFFRDASHKAKKDAKYVFETWGQQQKLLTAE